MPQGIGGSRRRRPLPSQRRPQRDEPNGSQSRNRKEPVAMSNEKKRKREVMEADQDEGGAETDVSKEKSVGDHILEQVTAEKDGARDTGRDQHGQHDMRTEDDNQNVVSGTSHQGMSAQEKKWWALNFEELYKYARSKDFGKTGKEGRKSGRVKIINWLCEKEGITPYVAPVVTSVEATLIITRPTVRPTGAISHPEAILRTYDPALQRLIDERQEYYKQKSPAELVKLAMSRSYQLLKDSNGKLPSKSTTAMSQWLAAWDVLKSPREKNWWLGDGIDLVNKAKAMGYQGPSKKYDVIVWLRATPEDAEVEVAEVAEPTPNKKREAKLAVSKRHAKGSTRPSH